MTDVGQRPVRWEDQQRWWEQYEQENSTAFLLRLHLQTCVPLRIMELRATGRPLDSDIERVRGYVMPTDATGADATGADGETGTGGNSLLCWGGEAILFAVEKPGRSAEWVTKLVDALAVLSFVPGGCRFVGLHFESAHSGSSTTGERA